MEILLLKCGELVLKGLNRRKFEDRLCTVVRRRLAPLGDFDVYSSQSIVYVTPKGDENMKTAADICADIFGIVTIYTAALCEKNIDDINATAQQYLAEKLRNAKTFKVETKRADKRFAMTSPQISREVGGHLHDAFENLTPKMENPDITVRIEIREKNAFITSDPRPGAGGMPHGTNGRAMLLLSGGIDSPVAGYMAAKRGLELEGVHFHSPPFTSQQALDKVLKLAALLANKVGKMYVNIVPFTDIQQQIAKHCHEDYFTLVMRRIMMRIAERLAQKGNCGALVTGESLGQVASQTMEAIGVTNAVCNLPVFRPCIGLDKEEIVAISRKIGTFDTSILPFEDCCTVFTPKHPQTKPRLDKVELQEQPLDIEGLIEQAIAQTQRVEIERGSVV